MVLAHVPSQEIMHGTQNHNEFMSIDFDRIRLTLALAELKDVLAETVDAPANVTAMSNDELHAWLSLPTSRRLVKALTAGAGFKEAGILKLECDDKFNWEMRIKMQDYMQKVHHRYRVHFVPNPNNIFNDMDELDADKREILQDAQLALLNDERNAKLEKIEKQMQDAIDRLASLRNDLPEISFEGTVIESKWPDDGTVLRIKLPAAIVNILNENRMYLKDARYFVRLEKIGE